MHHLVKRQLGHALIALAALAIGDPNRAFAAPPASFDGKVISFADADTLWIEPSAVSSQPSAKAKAEKPKAVKVRLHWADAPEVSHSKNDVGQAGGVAALEFAAKRWQGATVHVVPRGTSYDRIV